MQDFIRSENIKLYRRALITCTDVEQRSVLLTLLQLLTLEESALARGPDGSAPEQPATI
jgi:hypothetical protein